MTDQRSLTFDFDALPAAQEEAPASEAPQSDWPPPYPDAPSPTRWVELDDEPPVGPPAPAARPPEPRGQPRAMSVAELGRAIRGAIDAGFARGVWVEGEVVGARPAGSGHLYFTLKDAEEDAAVDVVVYKSNLTSRTRAMIKDGARVRLRGRPTYYAPRGRLQLTADRVELAGRGALLEAIERLKAKLAAEGLFDAGRKRALPSSPRVVGVVTSAGGAVIHDICKVAKQRGGARILLAPARVQGAGAAESIARALRILQRVATVDVIIVGRGGGSFDELLVWNDEALVRAVAACRVPVVSAVGHEVDVTLTDFAADRRAATPSQAAEMTVPDRQAMRREARHLRERLERAARAHLARGKAELAGHARLLGDPRLAIAAHQQALDDRRGRVESGARRAVRRGRAQLAPLSQRLAVVHPGAVLAREKAELGRVAARVGSLVATRVARESASLEQLGARLDAMSPLKVLGRGYAIATRADGRAVRAARDVAPGDTLTLRVHEGQVEATVTAVREPDPEGG